MVIVRWYKIQHSEFTEENYVDFRRKLVYAYFNSVKVGLEQYKHSYGHYPFTSGKYFFDSIKTYLKISSVYLYADSVDLKGNVYSIKKRVG